MPSPVAHTLAGLCFAEYFGRGRAGTLVATGAILLASNLPDTDFAPLLLGRDPQQLFHQSITHSLFFVLAATLPLALLLRGRIPFPKAWGILALAGLSHLALDLVSIDRRPPVGIPLLWPFSDNPWHSPATLFLGLDKSSLSSVFTVHNLKALAVETFWLLPLYVLLRLRRPAPTPEGNRG